MTIYHLSLKFLAMEPNSPELTTLPKDNTPTPKSFFPLLLGILVLILIGVFVFTKKDNVPVSQDTLPPTTTETPAATAQNFTPEAKASLEKFIYNRIDILSPLAPATGTKFTVISIEHREPGETIVVYSDTTATYTARGIFEFPEPKKANIVAFDIIADSSKLPSEEKQKVVEAYIKENISTLSPEKEVLGGKFIVTSIAFGENENVRVSYEDGHNAYIAMVHFSLEENNQVKILDWTIVSPK